MGGQARLPGGARRKASQRRVWHAPPAPRCGSRRPGRRAPGSRGKGRIGLFLRDADDDQVEVLIGSRTYRVRRAEVRSA